MITAGKALLVAAAMLAAAGLVLIALGAMGVRVPFGRLPGDLTWRRGSSRISFPLATSLIVSVVLTIVLNVVVRLARR